MKLYQVRTFARIALLWGIIVVVVFLLSEFFMTYQWGYDNNGEDIVVWGLMLIFLIGISVETFLNKRITNAFQNLAVTRGKFAAEHGWEFSPRIGPPDLKQLLDQAVSASRFSWLFNFFNVSSALSTNKIAAQKLNELIPPEQYGPNLSHLAVAQVHGSRDEKFLNYIKTPDWEYCDFSYNYYGKTKHGEYVAGTVYYGITFTTLPRRLPNVFFDAKKSRSRQFRFTFSKKQLHSLEGNFDQYFATYFPKEYTIDSMSFISPDVMHELIAASDYDIEIVDDKLCLYGPISTDEKDILIAAEKLARIKKELLDNILTYRDERVTGDLGRQFVAPQGMELNKSQFLKRLSLALAISYVVLQLVLEFYFKSR